MTEISCDEESCRWNKEVLSVISNEIVRLCNKDFVSMDRWGCADYEAESEEGQEEEPSFIAEIH